MTQEDITKQTEPTENATNAKSDDTLNNNSDTAQDETTAILDDKGENLSEKLAVAEDKFMRLFAEFENYKRRTNKERIDLFKTANQEVLIALLPVLDDFERSLKVMDAANDINAIKEGISLISNKLNSILLNKGLKPIDVNPSDDFNVDFHEAITIIPAPSAELKGKIIDVVEKGFMLNDKVIRFAKVVIGE